MSWEIFVKFNSFTLTMRSSGGCTDEKPKKLVKYYESERKGVSYGQAELSAIIVQKRSED